MSKKAFKPKRKKAFGYQNTFFLCIATFLLDSCDYLIQIQAVCCLVTLFNLVGNDQYYLLGKIQGSFLTENKLFSQIQHLERTLRFRVNVKLYCI